MMSNVIEYGPAMAGELPAVVDLCMGVEEQHEQYWPLRWGRREGLAEGYLKWLTRRLGEPRMLIEVARDGATVAGMILVTVQEEVPIYTFKEFALVQDLAVRLEYRRRGIARRLLEDATAWTRNQGLNQLRLLVATQNPASRAVFEKAGFRETYLEMVREVQMANDPG
jgi:GNAT superfamily N-acetyltransferase